MIEYLLEHAKKNTVSFHMPGHKGSAFFVKYGYEDFLKKLVDCDITEIPGADNLFQAEGIIKHVQERYAKLYDVKRSYLMVNGTSGGLISSILAWLMTVVASGFLYSLPILAKILFQDTPAESVRPSS